MNELADTAQDPKAEKKTKAQATDPVVLPPPPPGDLRQFVDLDVKIDGVYVPQFTLPNNFVQLAGFRGIVLQDTKAYAIVRLTSPMLARKPEKAEGYIEVKVGENLLVPHGSAGLSAFAPRTDVAGEHVYEIVFLPFGRTAGVWKYKTHARKLLPAEVLVQRLVGASSLLSPGSFFKPTNIDDALKAVKALADGDVAVP